ncbi:hypothetical protein Bbelb_076250 [Branchiostoma belcheri]|nr:hypothetical protein Bbelb_076250 [Branchiostoma belcheri]
MVLHFYWKRRAQTYPELATRIASPRLRRTSTSGLDLEAPSSISHYPRAHRTSMKTFYAHSVAYTQLMTSCENPRCGRDCFQVDKNRSGPETETPVLSGDVTRPARRGTGGNPGPIRAMMSPGGTSP